MPLTIASNIASQQAQRQLFKSEQRLSTVFERLSSGQRINKAADDAAGLAIASALNTDQRVYAQGMRNINDGVSLLNIADSTISELSSIVTRIQELAQQSANGSLSFEQRESLDTEAQELSKEFFRVSRSAEFNGLKLFDGSIENGLRLQGGYGVDGSIFSSLGGELADGTFSLALTQKLTGSGDSVGGVATGDFNGDGLQDFITQVEDGANLTYEVNLGNGDGTFQAAQVFNSNYIASSEIQVVDLNNDGILDIFGSASVGGVEALLGNGDGTFQTALSSPSVAGTGIQFQSLSDLNGDGVIDLAYAQGGNVAISYGLGDGTFADAASASIGIADVTQVRSADLNGDGIEDLIVGGLGGGLTATGAVTLGNGDGTYGAASTFSMGGTGIGNFGLGDINNDGQLDLVGTYGSFFGNGDGSFGSLNTISPNISSTSPFDLIDLNGDGNLDIATQGNTALSIRLGDGSGNFSAAVTYPTTQDDARGVSFTDFDQDGLLDFVAVTQDGGESARLDVYLGNSREGLNPILPFSLGSQSEALQALTPLENKSSLLSQQRGIIGAFQSRLASALNSLSSGSENFAAAESRIRDADIAAETSELIRNQIQREAAASVLVQANQQPALVIQLLGGDSQ